MSFWENPNVVGPLYFGLFGLAIYACHMALAWWEDRRDARADVAEPREPREG